MIAEWWVKIAKAIKTQAAKLSIRAKQQQQQQQQNRRWYTAGGTASRAAINKTILAAGIIAGWVYLLQVLVRVRSNCKKGQDGRSLEKTIKKKWWDRRKPIDWGHFNNEMF